MGKERGESEGQEVGRRKGTYVNNVNALGNGNEHVNKLNDFNILYANADSLPNKLDELKSRLQDSDRSIDIIGITDVYPKNCRYNPEKAELQIDGYDLFVVESGEAAMREVGIYVRKELLAEEVKVTTKFQESIWISIKLNVKDKVIVGCVYKSPSSKQENLDKEYSHILIMGDFNYPKINWKQWTSSGVKDAEAFLECIRDSYLHYIYQHVTEFTPTRENNEPSTLDLIFTNEEGIVDDTRITSPLGHSDHCVITFKFRCYEDY